MAVTSDFFQKHFCMTVVVKRQAEEVGKRAPDKLRAQENHNHKTRATKKARPEIKSKKTFESIYD